VIECNGCGGKCCKVWGGSLFGVDECPHLLVNGCAIYPKDGEEDHRPRVCIEYPGNKKCLNQTIAEPMVADEDHKINIAVFRRQ
jgi:hypothetical protein